MSDMRRVKPDLKQGRCAMSTAVSEAFEFLNAGKFAFVGPITFEFPPVNNFHRAIGAGDTASQPNFTIGALTDPPEKLVIGNLRCGRTGRVGQNGGSRIRIGFGSRLFTRGRAARRRADWLW